MPMIAGMPPATDAPNSIRCPDAAASSTSSGPDSAMSSLLAVTTDLPARRARRIQRPGRLEASISSTTMSASEEQQFVEAVGPADVAPAEHRSCSARCDYKSRSGAAAPRYRRKGSWRPTGPRCRSRQGNLQRASRATGAGRAGQGTRRTVGSGSRKIPSYDCGVGDAGVAHGGTEYESSLRENCIKTGNRRSRPDRS